MQETYVENIQEVLQNKAKIEKQLNIKLTNKGKLVFVEGKADNEFTALQALEAINTGFSTNQALLLKDEKIILQKINIKDLTKRQDLERIRGRIIGTGGRTLQTLHNLTNCEISLQDNFVGIIGDAEYIEDGVQALTSVIQGSKQGNVYARLEKQKKKKRIGGKLALE
jgi:ribosomal RNA assembly protein